MVDERLVLNRFRADIRIHNPLPFSVVLSKRHGVKRDMDNGSHI